MVRPVHGADPQKLRHFKTVAAVQRRQWAKHVEKRQSRNNAGRIKRTVSTKRKERKPRRPIKTAACTAVFLVTFDHVTLEVRNGTHESCCTRISCSWLSTLILQFQDSKLPSARVIMFKMLSH